MNCAVHGPTVRQVPWARHGAGHTHVFDQQVAWLATQCSKTAITELMRIAWRTVGAIITRVWADTAGDLDLFAGLRRIGIDEISYKRNYKYLTIVVDHDTGRLVWAAPGRDQATVRAFFDALGPERCAHITHVSADGANWIAEVVAERCPNAVRCADPFHVVKWATAALYRVAQVYDGFAESLVNATTPKGLPADQAQAYRDTLDMYVVNIQSKAVELFSTGYTKAIQMQVYDEYTAKIREALGRVAADKFPPEREGRSRERSADRALEPEMVTEVAR